jgi:3-hydroxy-9,10-secoandrosta-1,3,5(10)-triene-9,17-dione monooxygenase reductase component
LIIEVDLVGSAPPRLRDADHFSEFHVRAVSAAGEPDWPALAAALGDLSRVDDETAWIAFAALEALAGERARDPAWQAGLGEMVEYARRKGWVDGSGAIAAHVEWRPTARIEPADFRHVLGHYPTGVAVVTAAGPEGPVGMACNSFTAVSLDPPLVAVCPAKSSETWPQIRAAERFTINLMNRDHGAVVREFARKGADRFAAVSHHLRDCGPALDEALGWIGCELQAEHDAGDHTIALGRVLALEARADREPLVFFRGAYGTFSPVGD